MAKISVYFNNSSSRAKSDVWAKRLNIHFFRHEILFHHPVSLIDLTQKLKNDVNTPVDYIFSVGGDGTANRIIQEVIGTDIKLLIIPTGTANDLARELDIRGNMKSIVKAFNQKNTLTLDAIKVNGQYMLTSGGLGLTSSVAEKINKYRKSVPGFKSLMKISGDLIYPIFLAKEYMSPLNQYKLHIASPDYPKLDKIVESCFVMINNQKKVGGNFTVAPDTVNDDGKFNVTIFCHKNKLDLIQVTLKIMRGDDVSSDPNLIIFETDQLEIMNLENKNISFFGDGEILCRDRNFLIQCHHKAIQVCKFNEEAILEKMINIDEVGVQ